MGGIRCDLSSHMIMPCALRVALDGDSTCVFCGLLDRLSPCYIWTMIWVLVLLSRLRSPVSFARCNLRGERISYTGAPPCTVHPALHFSKSLLSIVSFGVCEELLARPKYLGGPPPSEQSRTRYAHTHHHLIHRHGLRRRQRS